MVTYIIKRLASRGSIVHSRSFEHKNKTGLNRDEAQNPAYREDALVIGEVGWEARGCSKRLRASSSCSKASSSCSKPGHRRSSMGSSWLFKEFASFFFLLKVLAGSSPSLQLFRELLVMCVEIEALFPEASQIRTSATRRE